MGEGRITTIETERLLLRPFRLEDAPDLFEWVSDPIVNRYMPYALYTDLAQARDWIAHISEADNEFAFQLKDGGKVIGGGSIDLNDECEAYELGYNLNRAYWGKGYATEAAKALIRWAYEALGAREFVAAHATANTASGNVLRKCGYQLERYGQYSRYDGSEIFDASFYRMRLD